MTGAATIATSLFPLRPLVSLVFVRGAVAALLLVVGNILVRLLG